MSAQTLLTIYSVVMIALLVLIPLVVGVMAYDSDDREDLFLVGTLVWCIAPFFWPVGIPLGVGYLVARGLQRHRLAMDQTVADLRKPEARRDGAA